MCNIRKEIQEFSIMMNRAVMLISEIKLYSKWGDDFKLKSTLKYLNMVEEQTCKIDIKSLTKDEMIFLGFPKFDSDTWWVPIHFHKAAIEQGLMKKSDDTDHRFGGFWCFLPR